MDWPALAAARSSRPAARLPFVVAGVVVGSVARAHLPALQRWPGALTIGDGGVVLTAADRDATLASINSQLRRDGLIRGWRDEEVDIPDPDRALTSLARTERAAARFWGTLTRAAHATGYVVDAAGRPLRLWIARRSATKSTDPGLHDNLVGGGVGAGATPAATLLREAWEEAGLTGLDAPACRRVIRVRRDTEHGLQLEDLHVFDLELDAARLPHNQDGEVEGYACLPLDEALALAAGTTMTVAAALVTLDFALRHALLPPAATATLQPRLQALCILA